MPGRLINVRSMSGATFEKRFPDEVVCACYLAERRWPGGFVCPTRGGAKGQALKRERVTWECAARGKQTSVTAGTIMHRGYPPLKTWFTAVHIMTSHSNGIPALQLQAQLGLGGYKTAWFLPQRLRRAMVAPDRDLLEDLVEADETEIPPRAEKPILQRAGTGEAPSARCSSPAPWNCRATASRDTSAWRRSRVSPPPACIPSSPT